MFRSSAQLTASFMELNSASTYRMKPNFKLFLIITVAVVAVMLSITSGCGSSTQASDVPILKILSISRVSTDSAGRQANGKSSYTISVSKDGNYVAFSSEASNLVQEATNGKKDVFVKDTKSGSIINVSTDSSGNPGNGDSDHPSISADGRYVAFDSNATNLVPGDTNQCKHYNSSTGNYDNWTTNCQDVFVKDTKTGSITRVSTDSSGRQANVVSTDPAISGDGRFVAFDSHGLLPGDTDDWTEVYVKNIQTGVVTKVSTDISGKSGDGDSGQERPVISYDGRFVAFFAQTSGLVGKASEMGDVFIKDTQTGAINRVNTTSAGVAAGGYSYGISISGDGRFVAFDSDSPGLISDKTNKCQFASPSSGGSCHDVYVKDMQTGMIKRISLSSSGTQGNDNSDDPAISGDGRYVAFRSNASNLVSGDTNQCSRSDGSKFNCSDVFLKDTQTGVIIRVSVDSSGNQANEASNSPIVSVDGSSVAFRSEASNLVPGDSNGEGDIFFTTIQSLTN